VTSTRITLDTNVLISSLIAAGGSADQVVQFVRDGEVEMVLSQFILDELTRVLMQKFELPPKSVQKAVQRFQRLATIVEPILTIDIIKEKENDNRILECAVTGKVDYLVTGDKRHILPLGSIQGIPIVSVSEFLLRYQHRT
jgi:putative PIN family toxin of toxin-antitoxin system